MADDGVGGKVAKDGAGDGEDEVGGKGDEKDGADDTTPPPNDGKPLLLLLDDGNDEPPNGEEAVAVEEGALNEKGVEEADDVVVNVDAEPLKGAPPKLNG